MNEGEEFLVGARIMKIFIGLILIATILAGPIFCALGFIAEVISCLMGVLIITSVGLAILAVIMIVEWMFT